MTKGDVSILGEKDQHIAYVAYPFRLFEQGSRKDYKIEMLQKLIYSPNKTNNSKKLVEPLFYLYSHQQDKININANVFGH